MTAIPEINEDQRDCLQEIVNVAMGQAGESLARLLEVFVQLSVPRIRLIDSQEINPELQAMIGGKDVQVSAVRQAFYRSGGDLDIQGEALLVFSDTSFHDLADLMSYDEELTKTVEEELLLDVSNILNGACLIGIAEQLDFELGYSPPSLIGTSLYTHQILSEEQLSWVQALMIEITYRLENRSFNCNLMFLMTGESIRALLNSIDAFLDEL
ncbi:MAG: chemotaxis protein CheC [Phenylobacterium sp.]|jgi:chemotaxis protein CheC